MNSPVAYSFSTGELKNPIMTELFSRLKQPSNLISLNLEMTEKLNIFLNQ